MQTQMRTQLGVYLQHHYDCWFQPHPRHDTTEGISRLNGINRLGGHVSSSLKPWEAMDLLKLVRGIEWIDCQLLESSLVKRRRKEDRCSVTHVHNVHGEAWITGTYKTKKHTMSYTGKGSIFKPFPHISTVGAACRCRLLRFPLFNL
jgi:hypothetical protein